MIVPWSFIVTIGLGFKYPYLGVFCAEVSRLKNTSLILQSELLEIM